DAGDSVRRRRAGCGRSGRGHHCCVWRLGCRGPTGRHALMSADSLAAAIAAAAEDATPLVFKAREFVPGRYVLVDGDYLVYTTCGRDDTPIGDARMRLMQKLDDFKQMAGAEHVVVHLTATGSHKGWRYLIATQKPYQGQRENSRRPKNW